MKKKESYLFVLLLLSSLQAQPGYQEDFNQNISFFYTQNPKERRIEAIGSWNTYGEALFDETNLSLLESHDKDSYGKAFFNQDIATTSWSVQIELDLSAIEKQQQNQYDMKGGLYPERGFAFWHVTGKNVESTFSEFGPLFGHVNNYRGVGIFFYNRRMKEIMIHARVNNGEEIEEISPQMNRFKNSCIQKIPDKENARFLIQNTPHELKVSVWQKNRWKGCLNNREVAIKGPGYIGVSASNLGIVPQFLKIKGFEFYNEDQGVNMSYIRRPSVFSKMAMSKSRIKKEEYDASKIYLVESMVKKWVHPENKGNEQLKPPIPGGIVPEQNQNQQTGQPAGYQNQANNAATPPPPTQPPPPHTQQATQTPPPPTPPPVQQTQQQMNSDPYIQAQVTNDSNNSAANQAQGGASNQATPNEPEIPNPYSEQQPDQVQPPQTQKLGFSLSEDDYNNMIRSLLNLERKFQDLEGQIKKINTHESELEQRIQEGLRNFASQITELTKGDSNPETRRLQTNLSNLEKSHSQTKSEQHNKIVNLERELKNLKNEFSILKYSKKPESSGSAVVWKILIVALLIVAVLLFLFLRKARGGEGGSKYHLP